MRIIGTKTLYECDHSSTNYVFFTAENKVPEKVKLFLKGKDSAFNVRNNTISFQFQGEHYIPSEIEEGLLTDYNIPVMIYEDYDWWNIYLTFDFEENFLKMLNAYKIVSDEHTVYAEKMHDKIVLIIVITVDYDSLYSINRSDPFLALYRVFSKIRNNIIKGDLSELELIKMYCENVDKFYSQRPETITGKILLRILERR